MSKSLKKILQFKDLTVPCRIRKYTSGRIAYELRYRRKGITISATDTDLERAKKRFIQGFQKFQEQIITPVSNFHTLAVEYLNDYYKSIVSLDSYQEMLEIYNYHVRPLLGALPIKNITSAHCQEIINLLSEKNMDRTAEKVNVLLMRIFNFGRQLSLIDDNPISNVHFAPYKLYSVRDLPHEET